MQATHSKPKPNLKFRFKAKLVLVSLNPAHIVKTIYSDWCFENNDSFDILIVSNSDSIICGDTVQRSMNTSQQNEITHLLQVLFCQKSCSFSVKNFSNLVSANILSFGHSVLHLIPAFLAQGDGKYERVQSLTTLQPCLGLGIFESGVQTCADCLIQLC